MAKAVTNSLTKKRRRVSDIVLKALIFLSSGIVVALTLGMIIYIAVKGTDGMSLNFLTTPAFSYPYENYGVLGNIINTLYLVVITLIIATPVGVGAAIYLTEYAKQGRLTRIIEFTTETLAGIPSIIYGLFGMLFFVTALKWQYSILAGAATVAIMVLPTIMRTTEEALLAVPDSFREASLALGAGKIRTIFKIVLPSAMPGILSGVILAIGRMVGETAALLYTSGAVASVAKGVMSPGRTLAVHMYTISSEAFHTNQTFATAVVLLVIVFILNALASFVAKKLTKK